MKKFETLKMIIFLLSILSCFGQAQADTIYFKDNRPNLEGIIKTEGRDFIEVEISGGVVKFKKDEISWFTKSMDSIRKEIRQNWERDKAGLENMTDGQGRMEGTGPRQTEFMRDQRGMIINAIINGKVKVRLILDTGASLVVLKKGLAKELGIDPLDIKSDMDIILADGRQSGARHIILRKLRVENLEVENVDAAILVDEAREVSSVDGLLGMSFLRHFDFKIDQKNNKLVLEKLQP
ncbi:TIGR02281 family clan AA aspartic protease [bacterium]|nr:MAG: TIGR02281 family clan AA aspartic protease [bacterium]